MATIDTNLIITKIQHTNLYLLLSLTDKTMDDRERYREPDQLALLDVIPLAPGRVPGSPAVLLDDKIAVEIARDEKSRLIKKALALREQPDASGSVDKK